MSGPRLGLDLGGTNCELVLLDGRHRRLGRATWPTASMGDSRKGIPANLDSAIRRFLKRLSPRKKPTGLGIASAGLIEDGRIATSPNLPLWVGLDLAEELSGRLGIPVLMENDVNAMAWGEWKQGAGKGCLSMVCLALGTGVGGGLILDGELYRGRGGLGAELGHFSIDRNGRRCTCGARGCLEAYAGARGIIAAARRALSRKDAAARSLARRLEGGQPDPAALWRAARAGDPLAADLLAEAGRALGTAIAGYTNVFAPDLVVVSGGVARAGRWILDPARREATERLMNPEVQNLRIIRGKLGSGGAAIGAALLAAEVEA